MYLRGITPLIIPASGVFLNMRKPSVASDY